MKKVVIILACILLVLVLAVGGYMGWLYYTNIYSLDLTMEGPAEVTLQYGEEFTDAGAHAVFYGTNLQKEPLQVPVTREGHLDTNTVGRYTLTYKAQWEELTRECTRQVTVVDTKAPTITLVADPNGYTLPGRTYKEEGFTATDEYDGDITDRVVRTEKDGVVTYTVADTSGNETQVQRTIVYDDPVAPQLTLKGDTTIHVKAGSVQRRVREIV